MLEIGFGLKVCNCSCVKTTAAKMNRFYPRRTEKIRYFLAAVGDLSYKYNNY